MLSRLFSWLHKTSKMDEYCDRFMKPLFERAEALGIPDSELNQMWKLAWHVAQPMVVGQAPGSIMRNLIDHWEEDRESCRQFVIEQSQALGVR